MEVSFSFIRGGERRGWREKGRAKISKMEERGRVLRRRKKRRKKGKYKNF